MTNSGSSAKPSAATTAAHEDLDVPPEQFFNEKVGEHKQPALSERTNNTLKSEITAALNSKLEDEIQHLKDQIRREQSKVEQQRQSQQKMTKEKEQQLQQTNKLLEELQQQLFSRQAQEQKTKDLTKQIKSVDYDNVESVVVQNFLFTKLQYIISHLKTKYPMDDYFKGIPSITVAERNSVYCVSVTGVQAHHDEFKLVLRRIQTLSNVTQSAKDYYQRQLNATLRSINYIMTKKIRSSQDWKNYIKYFQQLVQNKIEEFSKLFNEYITQESKSMTEQCINDAHFQSSTHLRKLTDRYMQKKLLTSALEELKYTAFEEFIKQHISSQQLKFKQKPSTKSLQTMNEFIAAVKREFKTNPIYIGCDVEQLKQIPKLLQRTMLYYRSFLLQLPLYESSKELLDKIEKNTVITIATSTGSGR
jgi:hypothetical protein